MRIGIIIQARLKSKRLPGKVMADIGGRPMIWHIWHRLAELELPIVIATPESEAATIMQAVRPREKVSVFEGPEDDVLERYYLAARRFNLDAVVRVTADCPFIDPGACRHAIEVFRTNQWDYVANDLIPSYPDGLGVEIFGVWTLEHAHQVMDADDKGREHVSIGRLKDISKLNLRCRINGLFPKLSVDTEEDLDFVRAVDAAAPRDFSLRSTLEAIERVKAQDHIEGPGNRLSATG